MKFFSNIIEGSARAESSSKEKIFSPKLGRVVIIGRKSLVGEILSSNFWMAGHCGSDATSRVVRNCRGRSSVRASIIWPTYSTTYTFLYAYDIRTQKRRRAETHARVFVLYSKHRDERNLAAKTKIIGDLYRKINRRRRFVVIFTTPR